MGLITYSNSTPFAIITKPDLPCTYSFFQSDLTNLLSSIYSHAHNSKEKNSSYLMCCDTKRSILIIPDTLAGRRSAREVYEPFGNAADLNDVGSKEWLSISVATHRQSKQSHLSRLQFNRLRVFRDTANLCLRDIFPGSRGSDTSSGTEWSTCLLPRCS